MPSDHTLPRRRVLQLLAATMGGLALPARAVAAPPPGDPQPVYLPPGAGKKGKIAVNDISFKLSSAHTSGLLGSAETVLYPGYMGAPPHRHKGFDEVCRVLEGRLSILVGKELYEVEAGGWHLRPRGITHAFWNSGPVPARFIEMYLPGGHERYMEELTTLFENGRQPRPGEVDAIARKHDIEFFWDELPALLAKYKVRL